MSDVCHHKLIRFIFYICWTGWSCFSQEVNNYENRDTNEGNFGSSYFFYQQTDYPRDCAHARNRCPTSNVSGVYVIKPDGYPEPFEVYCDNTIDSGGWTVISRRQNKSLLFNRTWSKYKSGFGFLSGEFWLGNDKLSYLTNQNSYKLRIDFTSADGLSFYVTYNRFHISDEYGEYKLTSVGEYGGTEEKINIFLCPPNTEGVFFISANCTRRCLCTSGQFVCDDAYQCSPNAVCEERNTSLQCYCKAGYIGDGIDCSPVGVDCQDIYDRVSTESGVYKIKPTTWQGEPFDVSCNMSDGGGWTVFQRRFEGSQDFFLYWSDYKDGFGTPERELWLGNDKLHSLTTQKNYEFRVDLANRLGDPYYAKHNSFSISDESDNYRLSLGNYSEGDTGDGLSLNNGQAFTTRDRDNDDWSSGNCATFNRGSACGSRCSNNGAWWYTGGSNYNCANAHLSSPYGSTCFGWFNTPHGYVCNIKYTEMKVRPI